MKTIRTETENYNSETGADAGVSRQSSDENRVIPTRRISFEESLQALPKHYAADGDLIQSHLAASLSALFPDGEGYFVRSVRHYRPQITDPVLKRQVNGFIGQEAMHGREHRALNRRLAELGYPTKGYATLARRGLEFRERLVSPQVNLALTAALEHFTATLAEQLLSSEESRNLFGEENFKNLFLWHALEESEHKAVAFDVYRAVGGSERVRRVTMSMLRFGFPAFMSVLVTLSLLRDRKTYRRGALRTSWRRFRTSPLVSRELWEQLGDYDRKGFHPNDRDTDELVARWREELFGDAGSLNELLVGAP